MVYYKFWMVYAEGGKAPTKKHFTEIEARDEARRLARKNGRPTYVLEAKTEYDVQEPPIIEITLGE